MTLIKKPGRPRLYESRAISDKLNYQKLKEEKKRLNIWMQKDIHDKLSNFANLKNLSKNKAVILILSSYFDHN